ncbi:MAG TPA: hypothetical protein VLB82_09975 [Thermodesulfobacteriota bacterium]|nr:hypothetical protein [Thermodesulfobacteriota bacterium]
MKDLQFEDAQQIFSEHPDTFYAPSKEELETITEGSLVKICVCNERFWTIVKSVDGETIVATVNNQLIESDEHNLFLGDEITFEKKNIYNIY